MQPDKGAIAHHSRPLEDSSAAQANPYQSEKDFLSAVTLTKVRSFLSPGILTHLLPQCRKSNTPAP